MLPLGSMADVTMAPSWPAVRFSQLALSMLAEEVAVYCSAPPRRWWVCGEEAGWYDGDAIAGDGRWEEV